MKKFNLFVFSLVLICSFTYCLAFGDKSVNQLQKNSEPILGVGVRCGDYDCIDRYGKSVLVNYPSIVGKIIKIEGGCILTNAGKVFCDKWQSQMPTQLSQVVDVTDVGPSIYKTPGTLRGRMCALTGTGKIFCWSTESDSDTNYKQINHQLSEGLKGSIKLFGNPKAHTLCGILKDNSFKCTRTEDFSKLNIFAPKPGLKVIDIFVGEYYGCAVTVERKVQCWGMNNWPEPQLGQSNLSKVNKLSISKYWNDHRGYEYPRVICADTDQGVTCVGEDEDGADNYPLFSQIGLALKGTNPTSIVVQDTDAWILFKDGSLTHVEGSTLNPTPPNYPITEVQPKNYCPIINGNYEFREYGAGNRILLKISTRGPGIYDYDYYDEYRNSGSHHEALVNADAINLVTVWSGSVAYCKDNALILRTRDYSAPAIISERSYRFNGQHKLMIDNNSYNLLTEKFTQSSTVVIP